MNLLNKLKFPSLTKNKIIQKATHNYLLWAFLLPFLGMLSVMIIGRYEPFGNARSMLYSDMYHQYYPFFVAFRKALLSGDSLLYSWDVGMGMDYLGLISYYLSSPLNLLSILLPENLTLEYFSMLAPIKLGLAGLFFAIFLKKTFNTNDFSLSVFGAFYGLCAWALGYHWNIMWVDTFALLPLVALGTVYLLRDKKFILYTITLFLSIYANYYVGLFTCIFVFLLFVCYEICRFQGFKRLFMDLGRIALFSVLAIGMTAVLELPALAALQNTQSSVNKFPETFDLNIVDDALCASAAEAWALYKASVEEGAGFFTLVSQFFTAIFKSIPPLLDGMRQVAGNIGGSHEPSFKEGLPNLYCGVGSLVLGFLFLTAKEVKLRDKICSVCLLVFFMLSFLIRQLDYIWHGFHFTNMIPYRFSFLFSFVLLYMAYRAWLMRGSFKLWQFIVAGVLSIGVLMCSEKRFSFVFLSYNISILLLILGIFIYLLIERRMDEKESQELEPHILEKREAARSKYGTLALFTVMCLELVLNVANFGVRFPYTSVATYPRNNDGTTSAINYMYEREKYSDFFRAEVTHSQTLNDGALNGYDGISTFTSSANVRITEFMKALGYSARNTYNRYCFEESSPVSNLFLNLKYMIERDGDVEDNSYFDVIHNFDGAYLLENNAYLPLGFLAESTLADWNLQSQSAPFSTQNEVFRLATGVEENVWNRLHHDQLTVLGSDLELTTTPTGQYSSYNRYTAETAGTVRFTYQINEEGFLCFFANMTEYNSFRVYKNGKELYSESMSLPQMFAVSDVQIGDTIIIDVTCKKNSSGTITMTAAVLDEEVFRKGYDILAASTLDLTEFSNTLVEGTIDCNRDGLLYTSIPYDGNWEVTVDGEATEPVLVGDCMMALNLTKGTHNVRFVYKNSAFTIGLVISLVCAAAFVGAIILSRSSGKNKGKYES
ncbi:MAG: YfhO family protein [Oscillospiraceae bacterium]|nr:YfhO family protein [Oscillospiraceae bacterium]